MAVATGHHDLDRVRAGLARWLVERGGHPTGTVVGRLHAPTAAGLSSVTLFAEAHVGDDSEEHLVVRLAPKGDGLFPTYDLEAQARVQQCLAATTVPVAAPLRYEPDPGWVGAPFVIMPRIEGRVLATNPSFVREGWLVDAGADAQARLHDRFVGVLGAIHTLDWRDCGLDFLARAGTTVAAAQTRWREYLAWASDGSPPAVLADALAWCAERAPADGEPPPSLQWGDVQLPNVVFGDDLAPAAVLDWELAAIGAAEHDLGWYLALHDLTVRVHGRDLPGFPDHDDVVARWERAVGRPAVALDWFEVFALVRSAAIMVRIAALLAAQGIDDSWLTRANPHLDRLAHQIEMRQ